jgi:hypothetical protein
MTKEEIQTKYGVYPDQVEAGKVQWWVFNEEGRKTDHLLIVVCNRKLQTEFRCFIWRLIKKSL